MKKSVGVASLLILSACGGPGKSAQNMASQAVENIGCKTFASESWTSLQRAAEEQDFPSDDELRKALLKVGEERGLSGAEFSGFVDAYVTHYAATMGEIREHFAPADVGAWKKVLAELEIGVRTTEIHAAAVDLVSRSFSKVQTAGSALKTSCNKNDDEVFTTPGSPVYGARKVLAVAYQSCQASALPEMTSSTPSVSGILDLGDRGDGGHTRKIGNLAALLASNYYLRNFVAANSSCFDVRQDPPIYNYGGKPFTSARDPYLLDLFTHVRTGGPTLGIDCSGYVFSALAAAGLKLDPDPSKIMKADLVWGAGSGSFKNPQGNNMRCLQPLSGGDVLQAGDIVAIVGHVFMIDSVGDDPFGLSGVSSAASCASLNSSRFDFVIAQSAPIKGGIGISRIRAADYMPESSTIRNGLLKYAAAACRARFGLAPGLSSPDLSIVRHLRTPACTAPAPLRLAHEECVRACE